jgi:hypothetical protein
MQTKAWVAALALSGAALLASTGATRAQFEVEEPEAQQGEVELEYNGDYHFGNPRRQVVEEGGEIIADENEVLRQRHVFAMGFGLTNWFKLAFEAEFEQERLDDIDDIALANSFGDLEATEIEFEGIAVLRPLNGDGFGAAALISYAAALGDDPNQFQIGPILKVAQGKWSATTNLFFVKSIGGGEREPDGSIFRDQRWDLDYAWRVAYQATERWALALEGFGTLNRLGDSGRKSEAVELFGDQDQHRLGPVAYYTFKHPRAARMASLKDPDGKGSANGNGNSNSNGNGDGNGDDDDEGTTVTAGFGVLFGLNEDTSDVALKWSLEVEF